MKTDLEISFKRGPKQSLRANEYFMVLGTELTDNCVSEMTPFNYVFIHEDHETTRLRYWAREEASAKEILAVRDWVYELGQDLDELRKKPAGVKHVTELIRRWMTTNEFLTSFMVEQFYPGNPFRENEEAALAAVVTGGKIRMLSAQDVFYIEEGGGIFGLSVARKGSYAIESK